MSDRIVSKAQPNVKVTVTQGIHVVHDGTVYRNGDGAAVPERVARRWIHNGWASESSTATDGRQSVGTLPDPRGLASSRGDEDESEPRAEKPARPARKHVVRQSSGATRTTKSGGRQRR